MKVEDLMIGDLVRVPSESNRIKKIYSTFDIDVTVLYVPIPLTPEILVKNGFVGERKLKLTTDQYMLTASEISDSVWKLDYDSNEFSSIHFSVHVCYVHELQHALRLFGVDKEIEL